MQELTEMVVVTIGPVKSVNQFIIKFLNYSNFYSVIYTVVTSEALLTCERLAQGRYLAVWRPGVEPTTC